MSGRTARGVGRSWRAVIYELQKGGIALSIPAKRVPLSWPEHLREIQVSAIDILLLNIRALSALFAVLHPAWPGSVPRLVFALWPGPVLASLRARFLATILASCSLPFA